jgi:hypothetical protein
MEAEFEWAEGLQKQQEKRSLILRGMWNIAPW